MKIAIVWFSSRHFFIRQTRCSEESSHFRLIYKKKEIWNDVRLNKHNFPFEAHRFFKLYFWQYVQSVWDQMRRLSLSKKMFCVSSLRLLFVTPLCMSNTHYLNVNSFASSCFIRHVSTSDPLRPFTRGCHERFESLSPTLNCDLSL